MFKILPTQTFKQHEILSQYKMIETPVIGHFTDFGFAREIKCLCDNPVHISGRALTIKIPHCDGSIIREALIMSEPGDILVIDTSGDYLRACWGELRTLAAMVKQIAGVIVDGAITDISEIKALGFPVFSKSVSPLTTRALNLEGGINLPVSIGGVSVQSGDVVVADNNGVFILNPEYAVKMVDVFLEKKQKDTQRRQELMSMYQQRFK